MVWTGACPWRGDIIEVTKETLEANIALIKKEVNPEDKDDNDEDLP